MMTYNAKEHAAWLAAFNAKMDAADAMKKNEAAHPAQGSWVDYVKAKVKATAAANGYKPEYTVVYGGLCSMA